MTTTTTRTVTNALGETREATRSYGDGSIDCPFCGYAIPTPETQCRNPWCEAHPMMTPALAQQHRAQKAAEEAEAAHRKRDAEWSRERREERAREEAERQAEAIEEAKRRGSCLRCLIDHYGRIKHIRHRTVCPKQAA